MRIGIISDTHGLVRPEVPALLAGSDHILHAGDIGCAEVLETLGRIAPVTAIRGNIDTADWAAAYPETDAFALDGRFFYLLHDLKQIDIDPSAAQFDVVVCGHSHQPMARRSDGVLYLNPGSAGPRRFKLPISLATLHLGANDIVWEFHEIDA